MQTSISNPTKGQTNHNPSHHKPAEHKSDLQQRSNLEYYGKISNSQADHNHKTLQENITQP